MKTQKHKLIFGKTSVVELDSGQLNTVNGGTSTMPSMTVQTFTPNTLPDPNPFPIPDPGPFPFPNPIPGTGTLPW